MSSLETDESVELSSLRTSFWTTVQREVLPIAEVHTPGTSPQAARSGPRGNGQPGRGSELRAPGGEEGAVVALTFSEMFAPPARVASMFALFQYQAQISLFEDKERSLASMCFLQCLLGSHGLSWLLLLGK